MDNKREMTIEEAEAKCAELADQYEAACKYADELKRKRDEDRRAELKLQFAKRKEEIDSVLAHLKKLREDFQKDYGYDYVLHKVEEYPFVSKLFDFFMF